MASALSFLRKNLKWQFNQTVFDELVCQPSDKRQLNETLQRLADKYYPQNSPVDTLDTEFSLNKVALSRADSLSKKLAKERFLRYWQSFLRLKKLFAKPFMLFPSNSGGTRIEQIAKIIAKCTQFFVDDKQLREIIDYCNQIFDMNAREKDHLPNVVELYRLNHYAAAATAGNEKTLAKLLRPQLLRFEYMQNNKYRQASYDTANMHAVVNCFGNAAVQTGKQTFCHSQNVFVYANGRNVFDTFCLCKFGKKTAEFLSETNSFSCKMQLFAVDNCIVKRYKITNNCLSQKRLTIDAELPQTNEERFAIDNASVACDGKTYIATALVCNNQTVCCDIQNDLLSANFVVPSGKSAQFDVVTVYDRNIQTIARLVSSLDDYGATLCPFAADAAQDKTDERNDKMNLSPRSNQQRFAPKRKSANQTYTYQLGNCDVATFLDNDGNNVTLAGGYPFANEQVFSVSNGKMIQLNCGKFCIDGQTATYRKDGSVCRLEHERGKSFVVTHETPKQTMFLLTLNNVSKIDYANNVFTVQDGFRNYSVQCIGKVQSFCTNGLETNDKRLRYKLSNNLDAGTCIAVCFEKSAKAQLTITSQNITPQPTPLVRESLVSTYLNYVNNKSVFCLVNRLVKPDSLTIAAICYTNPHFVRKYLTDHFENGQFVGYYYKNSILQKTENPLLLALGCVYYANLTNQAEADDKNAFPTAAMLKTANNALFCESYSGHDLCVKALALRKACGIDGFDKTRCAIEYGNLKKLICSDSSLYAYAQAIGAVPMTNPSKQRLKDLCNKFAIPKNLYYVSQLENLYGLRYCGGQLSFAPKVDSDALEQLALNIDGKRIDTTFAKSSVQSMTLNGVTRFQPFCPSGLKQTDNTLVVKY